MRKDGCASGAHGRKTRQGRKRTVFLEHNEVDPTRPRLTHLGLTAQQFVLSLLRVSKDRVLDHSKHVVSVGVASSSLDVVHSFYL